MRELRSELIVADVAEHPAVLAWRRLGGGKDPTAVSTLKRQRGPGHKSGVYRLHTATPNDGNVVAKRCRQATSVRERTIYQDVLPRLSVPSLTYYGAFDEPDGVNSWLFLEDAGDEVCSKEEQFGFMSWLGTFHVSAAPLIRELGLEEAGPDRYLEHLRSGHARIVSSLSLDHFTDEELEIQRATLKLCEYVSHHWAELRDLCAAAPITVVHGDLARKNVRVRRLPGGPQYFPLDWEMAGVGPPAADLGVISYWLSESTSLPLEAYLAGVSEAWQPTRSAIEMLIYAGRVFRLAAAIDWASSSLPYPPSERPILRLRRYNERLLEVFRCLGWDVPKV